MPSQEIEEFRKKVEALDREEIIDLIRSQDPELVKQINRIEGVFKKKLTHLTWDDGSPVEERPLTNEELALIVDPPFKPNPDLKAMGLSMQEQRQVHIASDPVLWAKHFLGAQPRVYQILMLRHPSNRKILRAGRRLGKALALDTPIATPSGWTTMGELKDGDQVFDENGKPCNVVHAEPVQHNKIVYDVVFSDGSTISADAEHLWVTHTKMYRKALSRSKNPRVEPSLVTTQEIKDTLRVGSKNEANHAIPVAEEVEYPEQDLPIDPYVLGVWLGDGVTREASLSIHEQEIFNKIKERGYELTQWKDPNMYTLHGVSVSLDQLNLKNNKHIPEIYLRASIAQRRELLAGLMDSDGSASGTHCEYSSKLPALAEGVRELAASLGLRVTLCDGDSYLDGRVCARRYRVGFSSHFFVFNLHRKNLMQTITNNARYRYITEVRERESVPVRCIEVDSASRLFLAGKSYIPTHNTWTMAVMILHYSYTAKNGRVLVMAPMKPQVGLIYEELMKLAKNSDAVLDSITRYVTSPQYEIHFSNGSTVRFFTTGLRSGGKSDVARGQEAHLIILDELDYMGPEDLDALFAMLQKTDENQPDKQLIGASTPTGRRERFWQWSRGLTADGNPAPPSARFKEFWFPSYVNPHFDKDVEEEFRSQYNEMAYRHEIEADWGEDAEGVYPRRYVDAAFLEPGWKYVDGRTSARSNHIIGVDWDKYGAGPNIVVLEVCDADYEDERFAGKIRVCYREEIPRNEYVLTQAVDRIIELNAIFNPNHIYIDRGYGDTQVELLSKYGVEHPSSGMKKKLKGISFSQMIEMKDPATKQTIKKEIKPFMVDNLRTLLENGRIVFPAEDEQLYLQLISYVVLRTTSAGRPVFEASGSQVDHAHDALILACLAYTEHYDDLMRVNLARRARSISNELLLPMFEPPKNAEQDDQEDMSNLPVKRARSGLPRRKVRSSRPIKRSSF